MSGVIDRLARGGAARVGSKAVEIMDRARRSTSLRCRPAYVAGFALLLWSAGPITAAEPKTASRAKGAKPRGETSSPRTTALDGEVATNRVQLLVDDVRARLAIPDAVVVSIIPKNTLVVSVERIEDRRFSLSLEGGFLNTLDDDELRAVVAHELGHVWIFTHHPYLQTEELANRIALQLVSRDSLDRVYSKVWARAGTKGRLSYFPGQ